MQVFINEKSLHEQCNNIGEFEQLIITFISLVRKFKKLTNRHNITIDSEIYFDKAIVSNTSPIINASFASCLNSIRDKALKQALEDTLFNRLNVRNWRDEQFHSLSDTYFCIGSDVKNTSIAELAERKLRVDDLKCFLINFQNSTFQEYLLITVVKNSSTNVELDCVRNGDQLINYLESNFAIKSFIYNFDESYPPIDRQTVLNDSSRFMPKRMRRQGRTVYREKTTGYYWYVDNEHYGEGAHLEVFDSLGEHIGRADLYGNIDRNKKDRNRRL